MSTFKNKNSLRTIEAQIVQKRKNNEKKRVACFLYQPYRRRMRQLLRSRAVLCSEEMQKRYSNNLPLPYYIFGAVNNSQLAAWRIPHTLISLLFGVYV